MAKALLGHVSASDQRLLSEVARLRIRVAELEALVVRLELERENSDTIDLDGRLVRATV